jgi:hypothetical protein
MAWRVLPSTGLLLALAIPIALIAQTAQKPLVNDDIVRMVKASLPESTIIGAMQANPINFDVSPSALIALHDSGVSQKIMDAMLAATTKAATRKPGLASSLTAKPPAPPPAYAPLVVLVQRDARQNLALERTRLIQTTAKPRSMASLAKDQALDQSIRTGMSEALSRTSGSVAGSAAGGVARGMAGVLMSGARNTPRDVTYVWALQGATSETTTIDAPAFDVSIGTTRGVRADDYVPAIVRLTPTTNGWRLVGATEGKEGAAARMAINWPIYSAFVEDRVPAQVKTVESGTWQVVVTSPLEPGEYALVLRPQSRNKQFAGQDVARNQGDGLLFNSAWAFAVR